MPTKVKETRASEPAAVDRSIGEEIKWNAPAFFYTGSMEPFDPKEYKRHRRGDRAEDKSGFLEGDYRDGRRLAMISSLEDLKAHKKALVAALKAQIDALK
jgi:hypothetical protein